nr:PGF-CTERM sorting domain-containing protein [uncultured Methanolobus sp.]
MLTIFLSSFTISVSARPNYMTAFVDQYDLRDTRLATCDTCHVNPNGGGARDSYGLAYAENGKDFVAIEDLDSDGDGFTNIEEINALTFPGHSADYPADYPDVADDTAAEVANTDNTTIDAENEPETVDDTQASTVTNSKSVTNDTITATSTTTTTAERSPGFEIIFAAFGIIAAFCIKR